MAAVADVGRREVKIYLFHYPAFFTFQGSTHVEV